MAPGSLEGRPKSPTTSVVANSRYAVDWNGTTINIRHLKAARPTCTELRHDSFRLRTAPLLALSCIEPYRLAVSAGHRVLVFDLRSSALLCTLSGVGRTVSCIAWSSGNVNEIALGLIDGSVSVWQTDDVSRPTHALCYRSGSCDHIAFGTVDKDMIASSHGRLICVWRLSSPSKPVRIVSVYDSTVSSVSWHPIVSGRLLTLSADSILRVWDVAAALAVSPGLDESDKELFGELGDSESCLSAIAYLRLEDSHCAADWIGEHGAYALLKASKHVVVYTFGADWELPHEVWRLELDSIASNVFIRSSDGGTSLVAVAIDEIETHRVPSAILDGVGGCSSPVIQNGDVVTVDRAGPSKPTMRSVSLSLKRVETSAFAKTARQLRQRRALSDIRPSRIRPSNTSRSERSPTITAMTSSLEIPKVCDTEDDCFMPFLSPSIPARKPSPQTAPSVDGGSLDLSLLRPASPRPASLLDTNDSDSDDEAFSGSGTFMPGGVNVPLPKACGALFAPNGQLLTFFPSRPRRTASLLFEGSALGHSRGPAVNARKTVKLFPIFGNFDDDSAESDGDDSRSTGSDSTQETYANPVIHHFGRIWTEATSSYPLNEASNTAHLKIKVSVHDVDGILPSRRNTAEAYRVLCNYQESGSDLCRHNADVAEAASLKNASEIWRLLAMLLEDRVPLEVLSSVAETGDVCVIARCALAVPHSRPGNDTSNSDLPIGLYGKLRWADHPYGAAQIVSRIILWAERNADIQMLALVCATLTTAEQQQTERGTTYEVMLATLPTYSINYAVHSHAPLASTVPMAGVQPRPPHAGIFSESPTKLHYTPSTLSSRQTSLAPTPSWTSPVTTPLTFPPLPRQNSRLSTSGSASPDHQRSSFSAAAKSYAQSITDKFASYGTSPPIRKSGTSPNMNELSPGLAFASSSWSKSVSFASTASTARESERHHSYTADDDDGYDSDKTIEDTSAPHTPKAAHGAVFVDFKSPDLFADECSGCVRAPLLPDHVQARARIWVAEYAEQLRCWGLWTQATEIEKVLGLAGEVIAESRRSIVPIQTKSPRMARCTLCLGVIRGSLQLCPSCLHTTHLQCLTDYVNSDPQIFTCPTGCGCSCADLPYEAMDIPVIEEAEPKMPLRKKVSFTDPRRWRQRVQGDSW